MPRERKVVVVQPTVTQSVIQPVVQVAQPLLQSIVQPVVHPVVVGVPGNSAVQPVVIQSAVQPAVIGRVIEPVLHAVPVTPIVQTVVPSSVVVTENTFAIMWERALDIIEDLLSLGVHHGMCDNEENPTLPCMKHIERAEVQRERARLFLAHYPTINDFLP